MIDGTSGLDVGTGTLYGTAISGLNPVLSPLADNGGSTLTHALLPGSPALDAGSNNQATAAGLFADQRGYRRVVEGAVDMGSVEFGGALLFEDLDGDGVLDSGEPDISGILSTRRSNV